MGKKVKDIFLNTLRNSVPASHKLEQVAALQSKLNIVGNKILRGLCNLEKEILTILIQF